MADKINLDKQANAIAREMMGGFAWPTIVLALGTTLIYVYTLSLVANGDFSLLWAYLVVSVATYVIYTVMHDAVHGAIQGKNRSLAWVNSGLGFVAGQILFIPFKIHQNEHLAHHRNTNKEGLDPDSFVDGDRPIDMINGALRAVYAQWDFFFRHGLKHASKEDKLIVMLEFFAMISWRVAFVLASSWQAGLVLLIFSTLTGLLALVVLFVWIVHRPNLETERYLNTNTILLPQKVRSLGTWLWLFQNYHSVHHLFPRVPFYKYRKLFEHIEPAMVAHNAPIARFGASK